MSPDDAIQALQRLSMLSIKLYLGVYYTTHQAMPSEDPVDRIGVVIHKQKFSTHGAPKQTYMLFQNDIPIDVAYPRNTLNMQGVIDWTWWTSSLATQISDLSSIDYFLWGHLKNPVYATPLNTDEDLVAGISEGAAREREISGIFECV
ncbi:hypothetical protein TNCV_3955991 [Trichonephila clavipes]|nr:hypothetical protein TNCV_3955991 [Trichonephila clavipes]